MIRSRIIRMFGLSGGKQSIHIEQGGKICSILFDTLVYNKHYQNFECHRDYDNAIIAIVPTMWLTAEI